MITAHRRVTGSAIPDSKSSSHLRDSALKNIIGEYPYKKERESPFEGGSRGMLAMIESLYVYGCHLALLCVFAALRDKKVKVAA